MRAANGLLGLSFYTGLSKCKKILYMMAHSFVAVCMLCIHMDYLISICSVMFFIKGELECQLI